MADVCDFCGQPTTPDQRDAAWGITKCKVCHAEEVIERADGVLVKWQVDELRGAVEEARKLFQQGKTQLALMAAQAAWNLALGLHNAIESKGDVQAGRKVRSGGAKGAKASRSARRGEGSKRAKILAENSKYNGSEGARVHTLVQRTGATDRYVRKVLKNPES